MCAWLCVCIRLSGYNLFILITSEAMWCYMNPTWLAKQILLFLYGAIVSNDIRIEVHHRNQPNENKLVLYTICCFHFKSRLQQLYISTKMEHFSYKGGHGMMCSRHLISWLGLYFKWLWIISNNYVNVV